MNSIQLAYLEGIVLAQSWVYDARLKGDLYAEELYTRLLNLAIEQYRKKYGNE